MSSNAKKKADDSPVTVDLVERMIAAALARFEMRHGHLSLEDGRAQLLALGQSDPEPEPTTD